MIFFMLFKTRTRSRARHSIKLIPTGIGTYQVSTSVYIYITLFVCATREKINNYLIMISLEKKYMQHLLANKQNPFFCFHNINDILKNVF